MQINLSYALNKNWEKTDDFVKNWCKENDCSLGDTGAGFGARDMSIDIPNDNFEIIVKLKEELQNNIGDDLYCFSVTLLENFPEED
jgi:hypothetical protein